MERAQGRKNEINALKSLTYKLFESSEHAGKLPKRFFRKCLHVSVREPSRKQVGYGWCLTTARHVESSLTIIYEFHHLN